MQERFIDTRLLFVQIVLYQPYGKSVDWWAFGVLLFEMLAGQVRDWYECTRIMYESVMYGPDRNRRCISTSTL